MQLSHDSMMILPAYLPTPPPTHLQSSCYQGPRFPSSIKVIPLGFSKTRDLSWIPKLREKYPYVLFTMYVKKNGKYGPKNTQKNPSLLPKKQSLSPCSGKGISIICIYFKSTLFKHNIVSDKDNKFPWVTKHKLTIFSG